MHTLHQDLTYLRSAVRDLEEYLLSGVLFWPLSLKGKERVPAGATQLTIGNLLLSLKRLEAAAQSGLSELDDLSRIAAEIERVRRRWKSNWDKKAGQEITSRLRQWDHYLSELSAVEGRRGDYPYNIRQRAILGLLISDLGRPTLRDQAHLDALDQRLKNLTHAGGFVWDPDIQTGFPPEEYWYLYRKPA